MTKTDTATVEALASAAEARFLCWSLGSRGPEWIQSHAATLRALAAERDKLRAENERLREYADSILRATTYPVSTSIGPKGYDLRPATKDLLQLVVDITREALEATK